MYFEGYNQAVSFARSTIINNLGGIYAAASGVHVQSTIAMQDCILSVRITDSCFNCFNYNCLNLN